MPIIAAATLPPSVRIEEREGRSGRLFKERAAAERSGGAERILCKSMSAICSSLWMDVQ